ncbi:hypothetical protein C8F01DRAFT_570245 [Mycena amicta]|nr:hypothetical protein C8F01DRAFT_570245 [Mycena amicta]
MKLDNQHTSTPSSASGSDPDLVYREALDTEDGESTLLLSGSAVTKERASAQEAPPQAASKLDRLVRIATLVIVLCAVVDVVLVLYVGLQNRAGSATWQSDDLEIRSPYVHLAELYAQKQLKSSEDEPIINHARAFVQIDANQPDKIFPSYGASRNGMIPEYERRLVATETMSTIAQFRIVDFGMEQCSLSVTVPARNEANDVIAYESSTIDIYLLPVSKKLNMQKLSYSTRPLGGKFFSSLPVSFNNTHSLPWYPCEWGTYQTFEFRCSKPGCKIDITGTGDAESGLYIVQHQSI